MVPLALAVALAVAATPPTPAVPGPQIARTPPAPATAFVLADVLRLRSEPAEKAPVVARLRIGTRVEVREERGEWRRVAFGAHEWSRVVGWTRRSLLGPAPLRRDEALARASAASGAEKIGWLERAAAIDPGRRATWLALAEAQEAAGAADRAQRSRAIAAGGLPGFLATCRVLDEAGTVIVLAAEWSPGQDTRRLTDQLLSEEEHPPDKAALRRELARLVDEVPAAAWFRFGGAALEGSPFARAEVVKELDHCIDEENVALKLADPGGPTGEPCARDDQWLATTIPLAPLPTEPAALDARMRAALVARAVSAVDRAEVRRIPGAPALRWVRFAGPARKGAEILDEETGLAKPIGKRIEGWALFGDGPDPLAHEVLTTEDPATRLPPGEQPEQAEIWTPAWSLVALRPGVRVAAIAWRWFSGGGDGQSWGASGYWFVTVDEAGRVDARKVTLVTANPC
ncbi:MAG TPA: SH3 domain-containing protein [Anaeromyxobacter sp.]|nr:SH3 domain-containing protein [Anaeromyxobacter sp.]